MAWPPGASLRPPWAPGVSICSTLRGWHAFDTYPTRSPLVLYDYLSTLVENKTYVEIGTQSGDGVACISHFAARAVAVERSRAHCSRLERRAAHHKFEVVCRELVKDNVGEFLPSADVYYWWMESGMNHVFLDWIHATLKQRGRRARIFFSIDSHMAVDMPSLAPMLRRLKGPEFGYSGNVTRLFFDEADGEGLSDPGNGKGPIATYERLFVHRPGQWGVINLLSADVGEGLDTA